MKKKPVIRLGQGLDMREDIRCTTAERDQCIDKLQAALAAGALPQDEALARIEQALTAVVVNDLYRLTTDLRDHRPQSPVVTLRPVPPQRCQCSHPRWVTAWGVWVSLGLAAWAVITGLALWYGTVTGGFADSNATTLPAVAAGLGTVSAIIWAVITGGVIYISLPEHISYCLQARRRCHGRRNAGTQMTVPLNP